MEAVVTIVIIAITVIGWISNAVNEQNAKKARQQPGNQPPRPKKKLQDEIENFLKEVKQQQGGGPVRPKPAQQPKPVQQRQQPRPAQQPQATRKQRKSRPERVQDRHLESQISGETLPHLETEQRTLPEGIPATREPSKPILAPPSPVRFTPAQVRTNTRGREIAAMLRSPEDFRKAFIVSEILKPPRALRSPEE
ncbi:MAG: hypothetical protein KDA78_03690 [Planctomycetaceae bacterium]|nr:hypothetical protein [Planctomycetaceae bacterium]